MSTAAICVSFIPGSGVDALIAVLRDLVQRIQRIGGLKALMELPTDDLHRFLFTCTQSNEHEVYRVLGELFSARDPLFDIEGLCRDLEGSIAESWVNCEPGTMFALRFLGDLQNLVPRYYLVCAQSDPFPRDITEAWLTDLSHGVHTTCRGIIEGAVLDCDNTDEAMAQFIMDHNLQETLAAVPRAMLLRARLLGVSNLIH